MYLNSSDQLIKLFGNLSEDGFVNPVVLKDTKVGFSIQKDYPDDIGYKPARTKDNQADNVAVIWVVYENRAQESQQNLIPIRLRIATMSKYRANHWDYEWSEDDCPTPESVKASLSSPQPLELALTGDLYFGLHPLY
jgi:hypothetical protein